MHLTASALLQADLDPEQRAALHAMLDGALGVSDAGGTFSDRVSFAAMPAAWLLG